jgi:hypothetical protein
MNSATGPYRWPFVKVKATEKPWQKPLADTKLSDVHECRHCARICNTTMYSLAVSAGKCTCNWSAVIDNLKDVYRSVKDRGSDFLLP